MKRILPAFFPILLLLQVFSCSPYETFVHLKREDLFSLSIGTMEDQFHFFMKGNNPMPYRNIMLYDDGLFYLANGQGSKLMQFTRFGELTLLLYNPDLTPKPILLPEKSDADSGEIVSRRSVPFTLHNIGTVSVDSRKNIYLEDEVDSRDFREENGVVLRRVIRRFDRFGTPMDTIGREGINGTPFPFIDKCYHTDENHFVVITRTPSGFTIYWFDQDIKPLYELSLDPDLLPASQDPEAFPTLGAIIPDLHQKKLFVMVTYYKYERDESTGMIGRTNHTESRIYTYDIGKEAYQPNFISIPAETVQSDLFSSNVKASPVPYRLLGISKNGYFFLIKMRDPTSYQIQVLTPDGRVSKKARLFIDFTDVIFSDFYLSDEGLLYAFICESTQARVTWWRSDDLIN